MDVEKEALGTSNPHQFSANSTVATTPATSSRALASDPPRDQRDASPSSTTESEPQQRPQTALSEASSHYKPSKLTAILQIIAGHLIIFDTFGYIGSWGVIESYYASSLGLSFSAISWIGSVQIFLVYFIGTFSGRALDAGYLRLTLALGCLLQTGGVFATSWSTSYWQLFLSQAICQGLGNGLVFCPMISLMSTYYGDKDRAFAISFAACGAATGGMVFPAIARELLPKVGIGWTLRVMGFVFLANSLVALALVRVRVKPRPSGRLVEWESFKEVPFVLFAVGSFFAMWGVYFAYFYLSIFGTSIIHVSQGTAFAMLMIVNGVGIPGRILPTFIVPFVGGVINVLTVATFFAGLLLYLWSQVIEINGLVAFTVVYGFFANAVQALIVGGVGSLTKDKRKMGTRIGMIFTLISFACLTGPPIAGQLIDMNKGKFLYAQMFGGTVMVLGSITFLAAARWEKGHRVRT